MRKTWIRIGHGDDAGLRVAGVVTIVVSTAVATLFADDGGVGRKTVAARPPA